MCAVIWWLGFKNKRKGVLAYGMFVILLGYESNIFIPNNQFYRLSSIGLQNQKWGPKYSSTPKAALMFSRVV